MTIPDPVSETFSDVLALRGERVGRGLIEFGIYDRGGTPCGDTRIVTDRYTTVTKDQLGRWPDDVADGPALSVYAGMAPDQFGHVILRSLGRLWAADDLPAETPLLFQARARPATIVFLRPILDLLGVPNPILFYAAPIRLPRVIVPNDQFGEAYGGLAAPRFKDWIAERLPATAPITSGRKVYLTRTAMGRNMGRTACEEVLEENLLAEGYEIIAPETLSLSAQVELYQSAETLLFAESSALHLYGLVKRPGQKVGVVARRRALPPLITTQLVALDPAPVDIFDAIERLEYPPWRADNIAV
ncbi:MAG: glycosyltransferase 61 family protein, partial [Pseudomonadota bacterium]